MKTLLKLLVINLLLVHSVIQAQEVQLGLRLESNVFKISSSNRTYISDSYPSAIQLNLTVCPNDNYSIEARAGVEGSKENYTGVEYGLFARYYPVKNIYGVAGVMIHNTNDDIHNTWGQYSRTLALPAIGIGLNPGPFFFEAMYLYPGNKEVGYEKSYTSTEINIPTSINWIWKFGFGFSFKLASIK